MAAPDPGAQYCFAARRRVCCERWIVSTIRTIGEDFADQPTRFGGQRMGQVWPLDVVAKAAGVSTSQIRKLNPDVLGKQLPPDVEMRALYDQALSYGWKVAPEAHQDNHCWNYGNSTPNRTGVIIPNGTTFNQQSLLAAYGARLVAHIVPAPGDDIDEAELTELVRARLARYAVPRQYELRDMLLERPRDAQEPAADLQDRFAAIQSRRNLSP